ncbi:hypothetical protein D9756_002841 [Leucocoprinus leucothites]|uniref:Uncharacterized protein n=1 Tax=Leucocoprinus leucothites TaxID=201217 RepID=A0A8H5GBN0_9AGAR|nr:hypothetical protein D9756_002841 [Leucoagaricus leucothites]
MHRVESDIALLRRLKYLRSAPMIPQFLRHLEVRISRYDDSRALSWIRPTSAQLYRKTLRDKFGAASWAIGLSRDLPVHRDIRGALSRLDKLTSVTVDCQLSPPSQRGILPAIPLSSSLTSNLPVVCRSSGDTITRLILAFRPTYLNLGLSKLKFPNLQEFDFELDVRPLPYSRGPPLDLNNYGFDHVERELSLFISSHRHFLQTFGLSLPSGLFAAKVLDDSPYLTSLTGLSLSFIASEPHVLSSITRFIGRYSKNIRSFGFRLDDLESKHYQMLHEWIVQFPLSTFPQLEYLSVSFSDFFELLLSFVSKCGVKVKTLSVGMDRSLWDDQVQQLAATVKQGGGQKYIQNLYLPTLLHFYILRLIAEGFTSLKSLYVKCKDPIVYDRDLIYLDSPPRNNPLATWGLEHLILVRANGGWLRSGDTELLYDRVPQFFPGVQYFNGLEREQNWVDHDVDMLDTPWFFEGYPNRRRS